MQAVAVGSGESNCCARCKLQFRERSHLHTRRDPTHSGCPGVDDDGDERTTNPTEILPSKTPLVGTSKPARTSKPGGVDKRHQAVFDALCQLAKSSGDVGVKSAGAAIRVAEIRDCCDPAPFDKCLDNPANYLNAVGRVLDRLCDLQCQPVVKEEVGYRLIG
jgi:hypothetical protein